MARYDLPATVAFILSKTKAPKLSYVGHSQGAIQMFAALSDDPTAEYLNSKIEIFVGFSPVIYLVRPSPPSNTIDQAQYQGSPLPLQTTRSRNNVKHSRTLLDI